MPLRYLQKGCHYVLLHPARPLWAVVNETGYRIACLCDGGHTPSEIARQLASTYAIPYPKVLSDIRVYLLDLASKGWFTSTGNIHLQDKPKLKSIFLQITNRCNLRCKHCYTAQDNTPPAELPAAKILSIIDELCRMGGTGITFSGGEVLTYPDITDIIKYAARKLRVQLLTNGTLITRDLAHLLADLGVRVQISMDGSTPEVHDRLRGRGAYAGARRGIELLQSAGAQIRLNLCTVIMKDNLQDLLNIVDLTQECGLPLLRFIPLRCAGRAQNAWKQTQATLDEYTDFFRRLFTQTHRGLQVSSGLSGMVFSSPRHKVPERWCPLGDKLDILPRGDVYPCVFFMEEKFHLGNIYQDKLADIFNAGKLGCLAQDCAARRAKINRCRECLWRNFCQAGCPGLAYTHTNSLWDIDCFCQLRQELYPQIIFDTAQRKAGKNQR